MQQQVHRVTVDEVLQAWAELQQLPAPSRKAQAAPIEFGELDDEFDADFGDVDGDGDDASTAHDTDPVGPPYADSNAESTLAALERRLAQAQMAELDTDDDQDSTVYLENAPASATEEWPPAHTDKHESFDTPSRDQRDEQMAFQRDPFATEDAAEEIIADLVQAAENRQAVAESTVGASDGSPELVFGWFETEEIVIDRFASLDFGESVVGGYVTTIEPHPAGPWTAIRKLLESSPGSAISRGSEGKSPSLLLADDADELEEASGHADDHDDSQAIDVCDSAELSENTDQDTIQDAAATDDSPTSPDNNQPATGTFKEIEEDELARQLLPWTDAMDLRANPAPQLYPEASSEPPAAVDVDAAPAGDTPPEPHWEDSENITSPWPIEGIDAEGKDDVGTDGWPPRAAAVEPEKASAPEPDNDTEASAEADGEEQRTVFFDQNRDDRDMIVVEDDQQGEDQQAVQRYKALLEKMRRS